MRMGASLARQLASNTLHAVSGRIAMLLVWLMLVPRILAALGTDRFAIWSLFFALTGYLAAIDLGLVQGTLRHVSAARAEGRDEQAGAFATLAACGFAALGVLWMAAAWLAADTLLPAVGIPAGMHPTGRAVLFIGVGVFVANGLANVALSVLQSYDRFDIANYITLAMAVQQVAGILMVLRAGWGVEGLAINTGVGWLMGAGIAVMQVRRVAPGFRWGSPARALARAGEAIRFGAPLQVSSACAAFHLQIDKLMLSRLVALAAVTPYELGSRIVSAAATLPQFLVLAVLPAASALHARQDPARLAELYRRGTRYVLSAAAVSLAATLGASGRLIPVWLGAEQPQATLALRGLMLASAAALAAGIAVAVARGIGRTDLEAWSSVAVVTIHVGLGLWLVPRLGLAGALLAMAASTVVGTAVLLWRLAGALAWPRFLTLTEPLGIPLLASVAGSALALGADRLLPAGHGGGAWAALAGVAAIGAAGAAGVVVATGYVRWREAITLLGGGLGAAR